MSKTIPGIVDSLNGLLIKSNASGQLSIAKNGTQVMKGEQLFLLSGDALLHAIELGDIKLAVNTPFNLDGISPLLKNISQSSQEDIENLLQKAVDNGIDPVALLETLEATAAGEGPVLGSGGSIFVYEPSYGIGSVAAGFDTFSANTQEPNGTEIPNILLPPGQKAILAEVDAAAGNITPITGINGVPQVGGVATAAVTEDANVINANLASGGTLTITDVDAGQSSFIAQPSVAGTYGTFTLAADGVWTYTANNAQTAIQQLGAGQTLTDSFTATSADGSATKVVSVTIQGTNDVPVIAGVSTGTVTEDANVINANLSSGGTLTIADVDAGQSSFIAQPSVAGTYGTFTLAANGAWTYTANNAQTAIQQLGAGQTLTDSFTATSADGSASQTVTVTITGTNDIPEIGGVATAVVTEDVNVANNNLSSSGTLTIADVDAGQSSFIAQPSVAGTYGTFTLAANGVWTYTANNGQTAIQQLGAGQTLTDSFTATSADGSASQTVTVTITGTNDIPEIGGVATAVVTEDVNVANNNLSSGGTLTIADVDAGQSSFIAQPSVAGTYGTFTLAADGVWTYTANNAQTAIQQLGAGQTLTDSFTATSADGTATQLVTVTIQGTNDVPVIAGVSTGTVTEDANVINANLSSGGTLTIADVDAGQSSFIAQPSVAGTYGTFTLAADGVWTYTANNGQTAIQQLGAGQTLTDSFTATSADGSASQTVTVTIIGTNDIPEIGGVATAVVTEDVNVANNNLSSGGTLTIADVDAGQSSFIAQPSVAGTYGTFTLAADGVWTYTANNAQTAIQQLGAGQTLTDSFTATSADGSASQTVTVTITGTNDIPEIGGVATAVVTEDVNVANNNLSSGGTLTIADVDAGQSSFIAQPSVAGTYGTFTLAANGAWTYTANNAQTAIQQLGAGQTLTDSFTATSADGSASQTVTVTITGTNDIPEIGGVATAVVTEDVNVANNNLSSSGTLTIADVDAGQSSFIAQPSVAGTYGTFTLAADGVWTYTANNGQTAIQQLGAGQTLTDSFTATSADGSASQTVTVTIIGTNDIPEIGGVATAVVTEDVNVANNNLSSGGTLTIADVDAGQSSFIAQPSVAGTYGTFTLAANGVWTYTANNAQTAIQQLGAGQTLTDSFTATSADGSATQLVTVTIQGTNDVPVIAGVSTGTVTEDANVINANLSSGGTLTIADVDAGQSSFIAQPSVAGTYGTFTLAANGVWTYTANNAQTAIQQLGAGQTLTDSFTATSADGTATQLVTVTIQGTNDVPVIAGVSTGTVTEDANVINANLSSGGSLTIADVDVGQSSFIAQPSVAGTYGTFTLAADGVWTYTANNAQTAIQQLGAGQTLTDSFTATSADGSASQTVTVTITGTNDIPEIGGVATAVVTEDVNVANNNLSSGGTLTIADVDAGQSSFIAQPSVAGTYGTFTLAADGVWTYTANNGQTAIQQLGAGQTLTDSFTATSADGSASQTVTVTITGTNDIPEIGGVATAVVTEDVNVANNNLSSGGTLTIADVDAGQSSFIAQPSVAGTYGTFTLAADGVWTYTANNAQTAIQQLGAGQTLTDSFTATSADGSASQTVTVTIQGTNDVPVIAGVSTGTVTEDANVINANLSSGGTLTISDVDAGQSSFIAQPSVAGTYGTFTLAADGVWTYTANNGQTAIQQLGAGQTLTDSFTATSADGSASQTVTVTITGTNDIPEIGGVATAVVTEDVNVANNNLSSGGTLTIADVDAGQSSFIAQPSVAGTYGTFTLAADGVWTYTANNAQTAIQQLGAGQTLTDSFTATSADGSATQLVTVTIQGTNDVPVIAGVSTGTVTEDANVINANLSSGGTLTIADVDAGQSSFIAQPSVAGTYGTFTLAADGVWTYTANNAQTAIQQLGAGQTLTDSFTATSADGSASQTVTVTITGTNDIPEIGGVATAVVTEDVNVANNNLSSGGTLTIADVDAGQSSFIAQPSVAGTYGTFTLAANGAWTYTANNAQTAIQQLGAGQTLTDSFTATSLDGTATKVVTVTIQGTNDVPVIAGVSTGTVTEDVNVTNASLTSGGTLTIADVDAGQSSFIAQPSVAGTYGTFTLAANGVWTYTANNAQTAIQQLGAGQTLTDSFTATSADGSATKVVSVTIQGTNDVPVIAGVSTGTVTEDANVINANLSSGGTLTITDVDAGQSSFIAQPSVAGTYGTFTLAADGVWTYTANNGQTAIQQLGAGQTLTDSFTATSADGSASQTVTVTITGTNDIPEIGGVATAVVTEDVNVANNNLSSGGTLTIADVDAGQSSFIAKPSVAGTYGTFTLAADGVWTYTANNAQTAIQQLGAGQTLTDSFTATSADGTATQLVTVTIQGTNDVPVIAGVSTGTVTEDANVINANLASGGTLTISDVDAGQSSFIAQPSVAGTYGTFTLAANGVWTYTANNAQTAIQQLGAGQTLTDSFTATSLDGTATKVVTVTIQGTNDVPVIAGVSTGTVTEDVNVTNASLTSGGTLTIADVDAGQSSFIAQPSVAGTYGTFTLAANGVWTYTANNAQTAIQQLGAGQTLTDSFTATSADGSATKVVSVTIQGTNDVPVIAGVSTGTVTEDANVINANLSSGGTLTITDVDAGQSSFIAQPSVAGTYGTFTLAADGAWAYTANNAQTAIQQLGAGQTLTDSFTATSADGTATQLVTVTIQGTNDVPVIAGVSTGTVTEDVNVTSGNLTSSGTLTIADVDAGQSSFIAQPSVAGTYGTFTLAANGVWTYTANNAQTAIQQLGAGQTLTDSFTATSLDGTATKVVTVTIQGTNDVPVIAGVSTGTVTEDANVINANLASGGTLTITDVDAGQSSFIAQPSVAGTYGTFTLAANGVWTYTANNAQTAIQQLGAGQTLTDSFTAISLDGTATKVVTVTIQGTNDVPVIAGVSTGTVTEDVNVTNASLTSGGTLTIADVDAGQSSFIAQPSVAGTYGTFTLAANGVWTYTANNAQTAIQQLGAGQTLTDSFTATSLDGTATKVVTVTIQGTNDVPVIAGVSTGTVTEDVNVINASLSSGGTLTITDVDAGQSSFIAQPSVAGTYGTFTLAANGAWTYTANNAQTAIQQLGAGQTLTDSFTATSLDGSATKLVTVTIQGTNDVPVIAGVSTGTVTEDTALTSGNLTKSGTLTIADVDAGQSSFIAQPSVAGTYGTFTLAANGAWTYTANNAQTAIQQLGAGQTLTESFTATSADGTATKVVTVTIQGTNDVPVIAGVSTGTVTEDVNVINASLTSGGTLTITDVDAGQSSFIAQPSVAGTYGTFTLAANGAWTYTANNAQTAIQQLGAAQTLTDSFTATSLDGTATKVVTVTIQGTNDVPVIAGVSTGTVTEDVNVTSGNLTSSGALTIADVDTGQSSFIAQPSVAGTYGTFTLAANGAWTYTANNAQTAIQQLKVGQSLTDSFTAKSFDGTATKVVTVTIQGTNEVPILTNDTKTGNEDTIITGNVLSNDQDSDGGVLTVTAFSINNTSYAAGATATIAGVGILSIAANGAYSFTPVANWSGSAPSVTYTVSDGQGGSATASLQLNVTAVADVPTLGLTTPTSSIPIGTGLIKETWINNILGLTTNGAGATPSTLQAVIEATLLNPSSTTSIQNVQQPGTNDVATGTASKISGLIYLEAGHTYTFSGSGDDSISIVVGNNVVAQATWGGSQGVFSGNFVPTTTGYYLLSIYHNNSDGPGNYDVNLRDNGGAIKDLSSANFKLYQDVDDVHGVNLRLSELKPDGFYQAYSYNEGSEDTSIPLSRINAALVDTDGSEILAIKLGNIPVGAVLSDGTHTFTSTVGNTSVDITGWNINALTILPPLNFNGNFSLQVTATATETSNGAQESSTVNINVTVYPVDDVPVANIADGITQNIAGAQIDGVLADMGGESQGGVINLNGTPLEGLTSGRVDITYNISGSTITAMAGSNVVFVLSADGPDGTYNFTLLQPLDPINIAYTPTVSGSGNASAYYVNSASGALSASAGDWEMKITASGGNGNVILNSNGLGVTGGAGNTVVNRGEKLTFDFDNTGLDGVANNATGMTLDLIATGSVDVSYKWTAYYTDGTTATGTAILPDGTTASIDIPVTANKYLDRVELENNSSSSSANNKHFRVSGVEFDIEGDKTTDLPFQFTATDGDGDSISGNFTVTVTSDPLNLNLFDFSNEHEKVLSNNSENLLIPEDLSHMGTVAGGHGIDTVKFNENNMGLSTNEIKEHFGHGGWEVIDMAGAGKNDVHLDLDAALKLAHNSDLSVEVNGVTYDHVLKIRGDGDGQQHDTVNIEKTSTQTWNELGNVDAAHGGGKLFEFSNGAEVAHVQVVGVTPTAALPEIPPPTTVA